MAVPGVGENPRESPSELAKLGARLIIQRAVEEEFDAWLGGRATSAGPRRSRPRAAQRLSAPPGADRRGRASGRAPPGPRGGRAVRVQAVPARHQAVAHRAAAGDGDRRLRAAGLSMRDVGRCASRPGSGSSRSRPHPGSAAGFASALSRSGAVTSTTSSSRRCSWTRSFSRSGPDGPQGGRAGRLGLHRSRRARPSGGDAGDARVARGLVGARARSDRPRARGAHADRRRRRPGLIKAVEQCWPASDRQHCAVHRVRNLLAKLPERDANGSASPPGRRSMTPPASATASSACRRSSTSSTGPATRPRRRPGRRSGRPCRPPALPTRHRRRWRSTNLSSDRSARSAPHQGDRPLPRQDQLPDSRSGPCSTFTSTNATNGIRFSQLERQRLKRLRYEGHQPRTPEEVNAA